MSYEYLKGMGLDPTSNASIGASKVGTTPAGSSGTAPSFSTSPVFMVLGQQAAAPAATPASSGSFPVFTVMGQQPAAPATTPSPGFVVTGFQMVAGEPAVPSGSVKTLPAERAELKRWCAIVFGEASAFYRDKLQKDPNFTYLQAASLAGYRNAVAVVQDQISCPSTIDPGLCAPRDTTATIAETQAFRAWWKKCHVQTFAVFSIRKTDTNWVPKKLFRIYKSAYTSGACPTGTNKTNTFEYKTVVTAAQLLTQEQQRKQAEATAKASADAQALTAARQQVQALQDQLKQAQDATTKAQTEASDWRKRALDAEKKATELQGTINNLTNQINTLNSQLAATTDPATAATLRSQIDALTAQLGTAQQQQADALAQAQAAKTASDQMATTAMQTQLIVDQTQTAVDTVSEQASSLEPWYIRNKWLLLVGGLGVVGGLVWYFKFRKPATAPTMNGLPVPTSARHPSGLRRNRFRGGRNHW